MRIVIDMNLGKDWIECLKVVGYEAIHWSSVGSPTDADGAIMDWASANDHVVSTADLDFGSLLAASKAEWPSVIQLRAPKTPPQFAGPLVLAAIAEAGFEIEMGALVTIQSDRFRVRPLPINSGT